MPEPVKHNAKFKRYMIAAVLVLTLGNGFSLWAIQRDSHQRCLETAQRATATRPALAALVEAHRLDGDPHATAVWQKYLDAANKNPIPKC
jgi:hypothetical protein